MTTTMTATATAKAKKVATLVFQVAEVRFTNSDTGYSAVRTTRGDNVSGKFMARLGYCYKSEGIWEVHPQFGNQFKVTLATSVALTDPQALGRFLSYQIKGIGEAFVGSLVTGVVEDGRDLEMLLDHGLRDELIAYVGTRNARKVDLVLDAWPTIKPRADLMSPLLGYGLTPEMATRIIDVYGNSALTHVETNPYNLILEMDGISFLTADRIAMKVGLIEKTAPLRLRAALSTGMRNSTNDGNLGVLHNTLITQTMPLVNESILENKKRKLAPGVPLVVSKDLLETVIQGMIRGAYVDADGVECGFASNLVEFADEKGRDVVWLAPLVEAEQHIARRLTLFNAKARPDLVSQIPLFAKRSGLTLAPEQQASVEMVLSNPVSVITGGPGTGKSATLKVLLAALDAAGYKGNLVAPTGKAAKRITESTGRKAQTMHSLLGFAPGGGISFNEACPLEADYLVLDECSMVDTELMAAGLRGVTNNCRIILVGDVDQLPSVGPGQVLRDIIRSGVVPVTRLTQVFRQKSGSGIISAAKLINMGEVPETSEDEQFVLVETDDAAKDLLTTFQALVASGVPQDDIQVLSPTHNGTAGCTALNKAVQGYLNPEPVGGTVQRLIRERGDIRVGDRVIQNKNLREQGLVNGDIGWVDELNSGTDKVVLSFPDKSGQIHMTPEQSGNLALAYAITVHKSQGAEAPYVLLALDDGAKHMLRRNLVYTAVTRGSQKVIVFASHTTLAGAIHRGEPEEGSRRTSLKSKLEAHFAPVRPAVAKVAYPSVAAMDTMCDDVPW